MKDKETHEQLEQKDLTKINKFRIFKSKESEEVIEGIILNANSDKIKQEEYILQNNTKGKELKKGIRLKGDLEVLFNKENYDKLVIQNEANKLEALKEGLDSNNFVNMFTLIESNGKNFKVKI